MYRFEEGKTYGAWDCGHDPIIILKRTAKMCLVTTGRATWRMKIREDESKNTEILYECHTPKKWKFFTAWSAALEEK